MEVKGGGPGGESDSSLRDPDPTSYRPEFIYGRVLYPNPAFVFSRIRPHPSKELDPDINSWMEGGTGSWILY